LRLQQNNKSFYYNRIQLCRISLFAITDLPGQ
jgi:hypothetical protein